MSTEASKTNIPKFPLRIMPAIRQNAEAYSDKEGVSLNQFINVAIAERVAHLQHQEWAAGRKKPTKASLAKALAILNRAGTEEPEPGDELPEGYTPRRQKRVLNKVGSRA